jgi:hypothetical protein
MLLFTSRDNNSPQSLHKHIFLPIFLATNQGYLSFMLGGVPRTVVLSQNTPLTTKPTTELLLLLQFKHFVISMDIIFGRYVHV